MHKSGHLVYLIIATLLTVAPGCATNKEQQHDLGYLAKSDIDTVADIHRRRTSGLLSTLTAKLYRRNPLYCKSDGRKLEACISLASSTHDNYRRSIIGECHGSGCLELALDTGFKGDRILALSSGLGDMLSAAYGNREEFFLTDELDPQKLYNVARNIEITVWRISNRKDGDGNQLILTDSLNGDVRNLSYERLFGKLISLQDTLAEVIAEKDNRRIKNVIQRLATAVFLPI